MNFCPRRPRAVGIGVLCRLFPRAPRGPAKPMQWKNLPLSPLETRRYGNRARQLFCFAELNLENIFLLDLSPAVRKHARHSGWALVDVEREAAGIGRVGGFWIVIDVSRSQGLLKPIPGSRKP